VRSTTDLLSQRGAPSQRMTPTSIADKQSVVEVLHGPFPRGPVSAQGQRRPAAADQLAVRRPDLDLLLHQTTSAQPCRSTAAAPLAATRTPRAALEPSPQYPPFC